MNAQAEKRITRARAILLQTQPFYGALALYLDLVEAPEITQTMAVDGTHLFYCADWVLSLSEPELLFVVAHEVSHLSHGHHTRIGRRNLDDFNRAADYAINGGLIAAKIGKMPQGMLFDAQYDGLGAEEIYSILQRKARKAKEQKQAEAGDGQPGAAGAGQNGKPGQSGAAGQAGAAGGKPDQSGAATPSQARGAGAPAPGAGQAGGNGTQGTPAGAPDASTGNPGADGAAGAGAPSGGAGKPGAWHGIGGIIAPGDGSAAAAAESADDWQIRTAQAVAVAKAANAGTIPGNLARMAAEASAPVVDVRDVLADLIDSRVATDYSFSKPNRRLIGHGYYLPGQIADGLEHLVCAVDTSGSMDEHMLSNCMAEPIAALESGKVQRLTVIFADTHVRAVQEFQKGDDIKHKLKAEGGGGTRFDHVMSWLADNASDATAAIYLTDMECRHFGSDPGLPVYWAIHGDSRRFDELAARAPFGDALYIGRLE